MQLLSNSHGIVGQIRATDQGAYFNFSSRAIDQIRIHFGIPNQSGIYVNWLVQQVNEKQGAFTVYFAPSHLCASGFEGSKKNKRFDTVGIKLPGDWRYWNGATVRRLDFDRLANCLHVQLDPKDLDIGAANSQTFDPSQERLPRVQEMNRHQQAQLLAAVEREGFKTSLNVVANSVDCYLRQIGAR